MKQVRGTCLVAGFLLLTLTLIPFQWVALRLNKSWGARLPRFYHATLCRLIGIRVHVSGTPLKGDKPVLLAANHTSWLDIPILSSVVPCSFVAKSEVGSWPFFGLLARLQRTVFVERQRRHQTAEHRDRLYERLADGDTLVLFPEGTSGDGNKVLPFNSAPNERCAEGCAPRSGIHKSTSATFIGCLYQPSRPADGPVFPALLRVVWRYGSGAASLGGILHWPDRRPPPAITRRSPLSSLSAVRK